MYRVQPNSRPSPTSGSAPGHAVLTAGRQAAGATMARRVRVGSQVRWTPPPLAAQTSPLLNVPGAPPPPHGQGHVPRYVTYAPYLRLGSCSPLGNYRWWLGACCLRRVLLAAPAACGGCRLRLPAACGACRLTRDGAAREVPTCHCCYSARRGPFRPDSGVSGPRRSAGALPRDRCGH